VLPPERTGTVAPIGETPAQIRDWFDSLATAADVEQDGSLQAADASARVFRLRGKSANTRAAYRSAVRAWCAWCTAHGLCPLPGAPRDVSAFIAWERADQERSASTIGIRLAAIRYLHRAAGLPSPTGAVEVGETAAGIRRSPPRPTKKRAATIAVLRALLEPIEDDLRGSRDRALLLVGFSGAFRRSELAGIRVENIERTDRGCTITLERSKASQEKAVKVPLPYGKTDLCPVRALTEWLSVSGITSGPVFRRIWIAPCPHPDLRRPEVLGDDAITLRSIARIVQARAQSVGFGRLEFGGHSLKRGALTSGMDASVNAVQLKRLGRHKSFEMLGEYLEFGDLFEGHALSNIL